MAENSAGPNLEGSISLNTAALTKAIAAIDKFASTVEKSIGRVEKSINQSQRTLEGMSRGYQKSSRSAQQASKVEQTAAQKSMEMTERKANIIARAANRISNMEQKVQRSNTSQEQQQRIITRLRADLQDYAKNIQNSSLRAVQLDNANTELTMSLGRTTRELKNSSVATQDNQKAQVSSIKALSQIETSHARVHSAIKNSALAQEQQSTHTKNLERAMRSAETAIRQYGTNSKQAALAQAEFRKHTTEATLAVRKANQEARGSDMKKFTASMRDMSSSVQLALGPLSGVASRITALTALFNRNAPAIAATVASLTGLTVLFAKSATAATQAETRMLSLEAVVGSLGDQAMFTAQQLYDMGTRIGIATLTSADAARQAAGSLSIFGNIGRDQFERVMVAAQGLSQIMGGTLQSNVIRLGRLLEDPASNFDSLRRAGITFTDAMKDQVETLIATGRRHEANEVILKRFSAAQEAAVGAAGGLAGAIDTAGERMGVFFEEVFMSTGAMQEATAQVTHLGNSIADIVNSDAVDFIGEAFRMAIVAAGNSVNFLVENFETLSYITGFLVASALPRMIAAVVKLTGGLTGISAAFAAFRGQMATTAATAGTLATSLKALRVTMLSLPFLQIVTGISAVVASLILMGDESENAVGAINRDFDKIDKIIRSSNLSDADKGYLQGLRGNLIERKREIEDSIKEEEAILAAAVKRRAAIQRDLMAATQSADTEGADRLAQEYAEVNKTVESTSAHLDTLNNRLENTAKSQDLLRQRISEAEDQMRKFGFSIRDLKGEGTNLRKEFLKDEVAIEELADKISQTEKALSNLKSAEFTDPSRIAEQQELIKLYEKLIPAMREELKEKIASANATKKLSRGYASLITAMKEVEAESQILNAQLAGIDTTEMEGIADIELAVKRLGDSISRLSSKELNKLATQLGVNTAALGSEKDILEAVKKAYEDRHRAAMLGNLGTEQQIAAQEKLNEFMKDAAPTADKVTAKYKDLYKAAGSMAGINLEGPVKASGSGIVELRRKELEELAAIEAEAKLQTRFTPFSETEQLIQDFENRKAILADLYGEESAQYEKHLKTLKDNKDEAMVFAQISEAAGKASTLWAGAMDVMKSAGKEQTKDYQRMALVQATIAQALAVSKAWEQGGPLMGGPLALMAAASVGAQIKQINSSNYATGGPVSGPGTGTSDSIPAWLSDGEYVIKASAAKQLGRSNLDMLNQGKMPAYASGGPVAMSPSMLNSGGGNGSNMEVNIIDQRSGNTAPVETSETIGPDGRRQLQVLIKDTIRESLRRGELDTDMGNNYGISRKGRKR